MTAAELRALEGKATPGPWEIGLVSGQCSLPEHGLRDHPGGDACKYDPVAIEDEDHRVVYSTNSFTQVAGNYDYEQGGIIHGEDTALIVALRNAVPQIAAALELAEVLDFVAQSGELAGLDLRIGPRLNDALRAYRAVRP